MKHRKILFIIVPILLLITASSYHFYSAKSSSAPRTGLVGWWTMDSNDINGINYYDKSGFNNHATSTGSPTVVAGKIKQALGLNGSSQWLTIGDNSFYDFGTRDFTMSYWVKQVGEGVGYIASKYDDEVAGWYMYTVPYGNNYVVLVASNGNYRFCTYGKFVLNKWLHIVFTRIGTNVNCYTDGVLTNGTSSGFPADFGDASNPLFIGSNPVGSAKMNGSIDDVRVYNRALSAQEVAQLYSSAKTSYTAAPQRASSTPVSGGKLVGWWTMDANDVNGTTVYDKSGQGNHGIITGATSVAGKINQARSFNEAANVISVTDNSGALNLITAGSAGAWVNMRSLPIGTGGMIVTKSAWSYYTEVSTSGKFQVYLNGTGPAEYHIGNITLPFNQWTHVFWTWASSSVSDGKLRLYVNGVLDNSFDTTGNMGSTAGTLRIGSIGGSYYFPGTIDDVRVYNYALSAQEVGNLYSASAKKYTAAAPREGLVGWWKMDTADINGTTYFDASGNGNHATSTGSPTIATGKINQAVSLNGSNQYLNAVLNAPIAQNGQATISGWYKFNQLSSVKGVSQALHAGLYQLLNNDFFYIAGTNEVFLTGSTLSVNVWHHFVFTYNGDSSTGLLYIDNVKYTPLIQAGAENIIALPSLSIGSLSNNGYLFNGSIDDVRVYNRALSADEVSGLYQSAKKNYVK